MAAQLDPSSKLSGGGRTPFDLSDVALSFEFFPPKSEALEDKLWSEIRRLEPLGPEFVSVTYGAGGGTQDRTHRIVSDIRSRTGLEPAAHLTCVGATREEIDAVARRYWDAGVRHIVALRGDPQDGSDDYRPTAGGYAYAADLVAGLKQIADFEISVAAYPEIHPAAVSASADLDNLKRKLDAGASRAITQFFFDPDCFLSFVERARAAGITAPIVPGILPITNFKRTVSFAAQCGATIPEWLAVLFQDLQTDPDTHDLVAAVAAAEQCRYLRAEGIDAFHFYTLNRADLTLTICRMLSTPILGGPARSAPGPTSPGLWRRA